ncbi:MAG: hypothetical protein IJ201_04535 [Solobacterium sp.]|nr:hypothetical protein [Solobacterium sp.]
MAVQTQQETKRFNPFESDDDSKQNKGKKQTAQKKEAKPLRPFQIGIAVLACIVSLAVGRHLRYGTTLFMEHRTLDGYLPIEEYVLNYSDNHEPTQDVRTVHFDSYNIYSERDHYETSRGIKYGSTWEEFVEAYGDETIYSASSHPYKEDGYIDWDAEGQYFNGIYTVRQFDEQFVKTGQIDPSTDGIDLEFDAETDGFKIMYSDSEKERYYRDFDHSHVLRSYPNTRRFYLEFDFKPSIATGEPGLTVDTIYSSSYR